MIVPVILSGGSGTRLWPLSRSSYPKQFLKVGSGESLLQQTARRVDGMGVRTYAGDRTPETARIPQGLTGRNADPRR